jgi:hypothetical protein
MKLHIREQNYFENPINMLVPVNKYTLISLTSADAFFNERNSWCVVFLASWQWHISAAVWWGCLALGVRAAFLVAVARGPGGYKIQKRKTVTGKEYHGQTCKIKTYTYNHHRQRLWPVKDRPVLPSGKTPHDVNTADVLAIAKIWSWVPEALSDKSDWLTYWLDRLTVVK